MEIHHYKIITYECWMGYKWILENENPYKKKS